jgi:hypothetical protein
MFHFRLISRLSHFGYFEKHPLLSTTLYVSLSIDLFALLPSCLNVCLNALMAAFMSLSVCTSAGST